MTISTFTLNPTLVTPLELGFNTVTSKSEGSKKQFQSIVVTPPQRFKLVFEGLSDSNFLILQQSYNNQLGGQKYFFWTGVPSYIDVDLDGIADGKDMVGHWVEGTFKITTHPHSFDAEIEFEKQICDLVTNSVGGEDDHGDIDVPTPIPSLPPPTPDINLEIIGEGLYFDEGLTDKETSTDSSSITVYKDMDYLKSLSSSYVCNGGYYVVIAITDSYSTRFLQVNLWLLDLIWGGDVDVDAGGSGNISYSGGLAPFDLEIVGDGLFFDAGHTLTTLTTSDLSVTVYADGSNCDGLVVINVTDVCDDTCTGGVNINDPGDFAFDDASTSDTIGSAGSPTGSIEVYVTGGVGDFTFEIVSGQGYNFEGASSYVTSARNATLNCTGTDCIDPGKNLDAICSFKVTDACGTEVTGTIRNGDTDLFEWDWKGGSSEGAYTTILCTTYIYDGLGGRLRARLGRGNTAYTATGATCSVGTYLGAVIAYANTFKAGGWAEALSNCSYVLACCRETGFGNVVGWNLTCSSSIYFAGAVLDKYLWACK